MESPFLAKFERLKVGIDLVVSEPLKDGLFFYATTLLFMLQLCKTEIGIIKDVYKTIAKHFSARPTPAYHVNTVIINNNNTLLQVNTHIPQ